ncbi:MAG: TOR complex subunit lst8 [Alyxoria varia]|nr:MAG: TOR complex subunit lst8 [Alyxoria varia]
MSANEAMSVILCTAGYDHTIRFWEALSGICTRQINFSDSQINRLCISPDKKYLAAAGHHTVKLYLVKTSSVPETSNTGSGSTSGGQSAAAAAAGVAASNARANDPVLIFEGHTSNITGVGFHCDTKWMVTSSEDGTVKIWDTKTGSVQRNYNHGSAVNDVVIHPNQGELISCDRGGNVRIWDLGENKCSHQLIPEEDVGVSTVTVASDGSLLCAGNNNGNVYVWRMHQTLDTTSLVPICKFTAHGNYITRVLLSPDVKHLATCSADHTTRIWAVEPALEASTTAAVTNTSATNLVAGDTDDSVSEDGSATSEGSEEVHSAEEDYHGRREGDSRGRRPQDGRRRATGASASSWTNVSASRQTNGTHKTNTSTSNSATTGAPFPSNPTQLPALPLQSTFIGHQRWVWDCAFSADSAYLVTACSDHYARLWEVGTQSIIRQYSGHHRGTRSLHVILYGAQRPKTPPPPAPAAKEQRPDPSTYHNVKTCRAMARKTSSFAWKLDEFHEQRDQAPFRILHTYAPSQARRPRFTLKPEAPPPRREWSVTHLYSLDSSFNPPSRAHAALARRFMAKAAALYDNRPHENPDPTYRLVLLLSVENADKEPAPLPYEHRLSLMRWFAEDITEHFELDEDSHPVGECIEVDVAVTKEPLYFRKAKTMLEFDGFVWEESLGKWSSDKLKPSCTHFVGSDTLVRILNPKYYRDLCSNPDDPPLSVLEDFFQNNSLCVVMRPKDNENNNDNGEQRMSEEEDEGMQTWEKLRNGELEAEGGQKWWAEKIEMIQPEEGEDIGAVSSTRIREAAKRGDWKTVDKLCTPTVATEIKEWGLYAVGHEQWWRPLQFRQPARPDPPDRSNSF